jgi:hypothetical protein
MRRSTLAVVALALCGAVSAKLPPLPDEAKAAAAETAAKAAWADKIGAYKLCQSMDRVADGYRKQAAAAGKPAPTPPVAAAPAASAGSAAAPAPIVLAPCADPGPYVSSITPAASKPLESSGAHSPPGMAVGAPSQKATSAEVSPKK